MKVRFVGGPLHSRYWEGDDAPLSYDDFPENGDSTVRSPNDRDRRRYVYLRKKFDLNDEPQIYYGWRELSDEELDALVQTEPKI